MFENFDKRNRLLRNKNYILIYLNSIIKLFQKSYLKDITSEILIIKKKTTTNGKIESPENRFESKISQVFLI